MTSSAAEYPQALTLDEDGRRIDYMNTTTNLFPKIVDFTDDDSMEALLEAVLDASIVKSVDLMAANPDIASQVRYPDYAINLRALEYNSLSLYVVEIEDGDDGELSEEWITSTYSFTENRQAADVMFDERIMEWKRNWGI